MELVQKEIAFANTADDKELLKHLIEDALENAVSAFDRFGRATSLAFANKSSDENQAIEISFQNIQNARNRMQMLFGFDFASTINEKEWDTVIRCFQKRHLLSHTMGVIDDDYIKKSKDPNAVMGRKINITQDEVLELTKLLKNIGSTLFEN